MNYAYQPYGLNVIIKENQIVELCIERPEAFADIVGDIYKQCQGNEGIGVLSSHGKCIDISKQCDIVLSPFFLDVNDRKIKNRLYQVMKEISDELMFGRILTIQNELENYLESITDEMPYPLQYTVDIDSSSIFKIGNVTIVEEGDSLAERLDNYIKLKAQLCHTKVLFLVDIQNYLSNEDCLQLYQTAVYYKINLVLIDSKIRTISGEEKVIIIDNDYCIIEP